MLLITTYSLCTPHFIGKIRKYFMATLFEVPPPLANVNLALSKNSDSIGEQNEELCESALQATKYLFDRGKFRGFGSRIELIHLF